MPNPYHSIFYRKFIQLTRELRKDYHFCSNAFYALEWTEKNCAECGGDGEKAGLFFVFRGIGTEKKFGQLHHAADSFGLAEQTVEPFEAEADEERGCTADVSRPDIE